MKTIAGLLLILTAMLTQPVLAEGETATEATNWCALAKQSLRRTNGAEFDCAKATRCIKMNNYGCIKNATTTPFPGQMKTPQGIGIRDPQHHVLFEDPKYSLRKGIDILKRYDGENRKSALAIAETWAPWCDTLGSRRINKGWGRTCTDGPHVGPGFAGPTCVKPQGASSAQQCEACNCPDRLATFYAKKTGKGPTATLDLFDAQGKPGADLKPVLQQVVTMELGFVPTETLLDNAIGVYRASLP